MMHLRTLDTPALVIDLDRVEANINRYQHYLDQHAIASRPHIKTHKIPLFAHWQVAAGAIGITCQKIGEAEVMAQAGCRDIFLPYNLIGRPKLDRLAALARYCTLSVTADSPEVIDGLAARFRDEPGVLNVLVECDTGGGRCGAQSPQQAIDLARRITRTRGLHFGGLMTYPCGELTDPFLAETKALLATDSISVERVSGGGSPSMWQAHTWREVNEYRVGTYIYGDRNLIRVGVMSVEQCAMTIAATVVSRPTQERGIVDAGSKTLTSDHPKLEGYGYILEYPDAHIYSLNEEHGYIDFSACEKRPTVGEQVSIIPNHCCAVSNMFNEVVAVRGDHIEAILSVAARGKLA
jgi:D-serine deaminase-like pyridoxal phosphate-dependent protein